MNHTQDGHYSISDPIECDVAPDRKPARQVVMKVTDLGEGTYTLETSVEIGLVLHHLIVAPLVERVLLDVVDILLGVFRELKPNT